MPQNLLEQLRTYTVVVADTGDIEAMEKFRPQDATTNPSLITAAAQMPQYQPIVDGVLLAARKELSASATAQAVANLAFQRLAIAFGQKILAIVPGRVSTEVDARLSYDTEATIAQARSIIAQYDKVGIGRKRILVKIASTWEGIRAAEVLQREGINCNMTLLFSLAQAVACAEAGAQLISPFVGRILDWHKKQAGDKWDAAANAGDNDPGVRSVRQIYDYYKKFGHPTEVMGASFRSTEQILALAGCDLLTISPDLLEQLAASEGTVERKLSVDQAQAGNIARIECGEAAFRWQMNEDAMATEKLAEGIRAFAADAVKLEALITA